MKVLKNNYNSEEIAKEVKPDVLTINCDKCNSELEITENDAHIGWLGARFITCPCCGEESMVDELDGITLTKDNLEFPVRFNRTTKGLRHVVEVHSVFCKHFLEKNAKYFWRCIILQFPFATFGNSILQ